MPMDLNKATVVRQPIWSVELPTASGRIATPTFEGVPARSAVPTPAARPADELTLSLPTAQLYEGSSGRDVRTLQAKLNELGFATGGVDGDFGARTERAVRRFQRSRGLTPDGIVGPATWEALLSTRPSAPPATPARSGPARTPAAPAAARPHRTAPPEQHHGETVQTDAGPMVRRGSELISPRIAPMFDRMREAAAADGVDLRIRDGYRTRREQVILWNRYGRNRKRVGAPDHSNHREGTAIDFANTRGAWRWLKRNAQKFGMHNYAPEPWHYSLNGR